MKAIESWILEVFACHRLVALKKQSAENFETTVTTAGGLSIMMSGLVILWLFFPIGILFLQPETLKVVLGIALMTYLFGGWYVTDKIYNRNLDRIKRIADQIRDDPTKGVCWARRRTYFRLIANMGLMVLITLGVAYFKGAWS